MIDELKLRQKLGSTIQVGLIGAGAMGIGIAWQIGKTPGMELSFIADINQDAAKKAEIAYGKPVKLFTKAEQALDDEAVKLDVLVEASNTISAAARYCLKAIRRKAHVVLMNAEVDLILGFYLQHEAEKYQVVVTSDAGDQHGVLARMIEEIDLWGFDIVQAGNIKGFLDRYATADTKRDIAKKLNLSLVQCVAYTDGTKLNIEMALIANGANLLPSVPGMQGPRAEHVNESLNLFNFDAYKNRGRIDYILGANPGGGVYVIGKCEDRLQEGYMKYYKVEQKYPYYLFYRPYHLCHLETPRAIALAALWNKAVLTPRYGRLTDVYAYAKQPLASGVQFDHGIGGDSVYGLVDEASQADKANYLPIGLLDTEKSDPKPILKHSADKDQPIHWNDVELPDTELLRLYKKQQQLFMIEEPVVA